jgi:hypothetical protein
MHTDFSAHCRDGKGPRGLPRECDLGVFPHSGFSGQFITKSLRFQLTPLWKSLKIKE